MSNKNSQYWLNIFSAYLLLGLQIAYGLAVIPIALYHLAAQEFGVWVLAVQVVVWLQLLDAGMNGAVARYLIDYKDDPDGDSCRKCIGTGFVVLVIQALMVFGVSLTLAFNGSGFFSIPTEYSNDFRNVITLLGAAGAIGFFSKIIQSWMYANQRLDLINWISLGATLVEWALVVVFFKLGKGVYSLAFARIIMASLAFISFWSLGIGVTGFRIKYVFTGWDRGMFFKLGRFGLGMFVLSLATQMMNASQTMLVSKYLGLGAAAIWATAPKLGLLILQLVAKLWDYAIPKLSGQMATEDFEGLWVDFQKLFKMISIIGGVLLGGMVALNADFLVIWTMGEIQWNFVNTVLLALGIYTNLLVRCFTDFVMHTKKIGKMPILMLGEGVMFIGLAVVMIPRFGVSGMLAASLCIGCILRLPYAFSRFKSYLSLHNQDTLPLLMCALSGFAGAFIVWGSITVVNQMLMGQHVVARFLLSGSCGAVIVIAWMWKTFRSQKGSSKTPSS